MNRDHNTSDSQKQEGSQEYRRERPKFTVIRPQGKKHVLDEDELEYEAHKDDEPEYEYVPITEITKGPLGSVVRVIKDNMLVITFAVIAAVLFLIGSIGKDVSSTIFLALAFAFLAASAAYLLYEAWKDKKSAEADYERARLLLDPVKKKMQDEVDE